jgi:hypothetical protein
VRHSADQLLSAFDRYPQYVSNPRRRQPTTIPEIVRGSLPLGKRFEHRSDSLSPLCTGLRFDKPIQHRIDLILTLITMNVTSMRPLRTPSRSLVATNLI